MKSLGIAFGGGGLRGAAHIGVLQVLHENKINPRYISGTSAGALVAACYAAGCTPEQMEREFSTISREDYLDYNWRELVGWGFNFFMRRKARWPYGVIKGDRLERLVYELTRGKTLAEAGLPLAIIAVDLNTGRRVIFTNCNMEIEDTRTIIIKDALLSEAVRASTSIPVTFVPRQWQGLWLVDGGLKDIVPVQALKVMGADYVLGVDLLAGQLEQPVQDMFEIIQRSIDIMVQETSWLDQQLFADHIIFPDVEDIGLGQTEKIPACIQAGRQAMHQALPKVKSGLVTSTGIFTYNSQ